MRIQVKDFMITSIVTSTADKTVKEIRELMEYNGIHAVPIIAYEKKLPNNETTIQGIVTTSDLVGITNDFAIVEDFMTNNVHIVHQESSAKAAAKMMLKHDVHHIVVMDKGHIVGIISSADFVKLVAEHSLE